MPPWFWILTTFLFGICVGSYLNVVIYRLPLGKSTAEPAWSFCPNCPDDGKGGNRLSAIDLLPLVSFLALGRKCRRCRQPISWRYFSIELLTGLLFVASYLRFSENAPYAVALILFSAVLVPICFIDLATFTIPTSLNLLAFLIPVGLDAYGIAAHLPGHELLWGWLPRSLFGGFGGALLFGAVRVLGWLAYRKEAMGLGDIYLARSMGAMLALFTPAGLFPLALFPSWVLMSCLSGIVVGIPLINLREKAVSAGEAAEEAPAYEEEPGTFARQLLDIALVLVVEDALHYWRLVRKKIPPEYEPAEDDGWQPAPSAIPFGPFLVVGFLLTAYFGVWATALYMKSFWPSQENRPDMAN